MLRKTDKRLWENFAKYGDSFSEVWSSGRSLRGVIQSSKVFPRKAQWAVMASMEMEKLRAGLEAPLPALVLMLSLELGSSMVLLDHRYAQNTDAL